MVLYPSNKELPQTQHHPRACEPTQFPSLWLKWCVTIQAESCVFLYCTGLFDCVLLDSMVSSGNKVHWEERLFLDTL